MSDVKLPESMKAQFLDAFNTPYKLRSTPIPKPTSKHDLLIKVDAASYCQFVPTFITILTQTLKTNTFPSTDAVLSSGQMAPHPPSLPHICSHEFAGTIITAPTSSIYKPGDKGISFTSSPNLLLFSPYSPKNLITISSLSFQTCHHFKTLSLMRS